MDPLFTVEGDRIQCDLCPHYCNIAAGKAGICGVRRNTGEKIALATYGVISGYALDPVEKKPLYHFFPGFNVLSVGSYGCNMKCDFCQNCTISQQIPERLVAETTPEKLVRAAKNSNRNIGLAYTYNEPLIWFEFMRDTATAAREEGLYNVMVSNGFVNPGPLNELISFIDAFNIDLKAFSNSFYKRLTGAVLEPVKQTLRQIAASGRHLEITTLIIPGQNDDENEMEQQAKWISEELGKGIPLHLSRYFPMYRRNDPATRLEDLGKLYQIASKYLDFVYIGNSTGIAGQNTICPNCGTTVTIRSGYHTSIVNVDQDGSCANCRNQIYRNFTL